MHTGYRKEQTVQHPEIGAMIAKYLGAPGLGPAPFHSGGGRRRRIVACLRPGLPGTGLSAVPPVRRCRHAGPYSPYVAADAQRRRNDLLRFVDEGFARQQQDAGPRARLRWRKKKRSACSRRKPCSTSRRSGALPRPLRRHGLRQELPDGPAADRGRRGFRGSRAGQLRLPYR